MAPRCFNNDVRQWTLPWARGANFRIMRVPSAVVLGAATIFLLYLIPWNNLPAVPNHGSLRNVEEGQLQPQIRVRHILPASDIQLESSDIPGLISYRSIQSSNTTFNASGVDVLVILHIQKTGGTSFEKHIVQDLQVDRPCSCWKNRKKRCKCLRPGVMIAGSNETVGSPSDVRQRADSWLFSRFSIGWACGLHADWTELTGCVDGELSRVHGSSPERRYFYVTMIRDPIHRFLSEYRHVKRGATWKASRHFCNGRIATADELGSCYAGSSWKGVNLTNFLSCTHNLAFNRQSRMLADLTLVGCYNSSYMAQEERNRVILASAKRNLEQMAFVGITEHQRMSQYVFEETFKVRFRIPFTQNEETFSKDTLDKTSPEELDLVRKANALDMDLYVFAQQLLYSRFQDLRSKDEDFNDHYNYIGEDKSNRFTWDEVEKEDK